MSYFGGFGGRENELQRCNGATLVMKILYILHCLQMSTTSGWGNRGFAGLKVEVCRLESRSLQA